MINMYYEDILTKVVDKYKHLHTEAKNDLDIKVLANVVRRPHNSPKSHSEYLQINYDKVMQILRYFGINGRENKKIVFKEIDAFLSLIMAQLNHERADTIDIELRQFIQDLPDRLYKQNGTPRAMRGFYLLALFKFCSDRAYRHIFPQRQSWIQTLSAVEARNFFRDISYEIYKSAQDFNVNSLTALINESVLENTTRDTTIEQEETAEDKIQALEFKLQTTQSTLQFIQHSLDDMVANVEQKTQAAQNEAINNFFALLNSERYGRLLDSSLLIDQKITALRKQHYKFPLEVMAMPMIIKNFIAFTKSIGFEPIRTLGEQFSATAEDLTYDVYEGSPFMGNETKTVQVTCCGWKREGVILSKPVVKEIVAEEK